MMPSGEFFLLLELKYIYVGLGEPGVTCAHDDIKGIFQQVLVEPFDIKHICKAFTFQMGIVLFSLNHPEYDELTWLQHHRKRHHRLLWTMEVE